MQLILKRDLICIFNFFTIFANLKSDLIFANMIERSLASKIQYLATKFPIVALTGPRQSGKSTLLKYLFPDYEYVSLEDLDMRTFASDDPRGFLTTFSNHVIIRDTLGTSWRHIWWTIIL